MKPCERCNGMLNDSQDECHYCHHIQSSSIQPEEHTSPDPYKHASASKALWLLPLFLLFVGGIIMYSFAKNHRGNTARNGLIFGFVWTPIALLIPLFMLGGIVSDALLNPSTSWSMPIFGPKITDLSQVDTASCDSLAESDEHYKDLLQLCRFGGCNPDELRLARSVLSEYQQRCVNP